MGAKAQRVPLWVRVPVPAWVVKWLREEMGEPEYRPELALQMAADGSDVQREDACVYPISLNTWLGRVCCYMPHPKNHRAFRRRVGQGVGHSVILELPARWRQVPIDETGVEQLGKIIRRHCQEQMVAQVRFALRMDPRLEEKTAVIMALKAAGVDELYELDNAYAVWKAAAARTVRHKKPVLEVQERGDRAVQGRLF